jgi:sec-independent protein translocase protein TatA
MGLDNPIHLVLLLGILLMVFGAKRLPEMGRSLGAGLRGFKESINGDTAIGRLDEAVSAAHAHTDDTVHEPATRA